MIHIGLTGWGDHTSLYGKNTLSQNKLFEYAGYFPTVEVDASFYAVQSVHNAETWVRKTPDSFQFIVKAYQGMTGHNREDTPYSSNEEMFSAFIDSLVPYRKAGKLAMVLFQFPPWFDCTKGNVQYLRACRKKMGDIPCALEFRHQSWFEHKYREGTLRFMKEENWIHSICDEPQVKPGSVPTVLEVGGEEKVLIRLHGRNHYGWQQNNNPNWREVRYLYRYNTVELKEWAENIRQLETKCKDIYVVFNNNSGGDAADNGKELIKLLNIEYTDLAPRQLDLF